ncbi:hypothetical protein H0H92_012085 [Tricholoma furcatifolium]|nr:hypothetical protein H0H92_012085 [Tricholoma furcatifolium]
MPDITEELRTELKIALDFNLPKPPLQEDSLCPKLTHPLTFYDSHLDKHLSLKKVKPAPTFLHDLSNSIDIALEKVITDGASLPAVDMGFPSPSQYWELVGRARAKDVKGIGNIYSAAVSFACRIASMLVLHPTAATWSTAIWMAPRVTSRNQEYYTLHEEYIAEFLPPYISESEKKGFLIPTVGEDAWEAWADDERTFFKEMERRFRQMGVWQSFFACKEAEDALKALDRLATLDTFPEILPSSLAGHFMPVTTSLAASPDAHSTAWGATVSSWTGITPQSMETNASRKIPRPSRRNTRSTRLNLKPNQSANKLQETPGMKHVKHTPATVPERMWPTVSVSLRKRDMETIDHDMATSIIQHAWTRAVETDSSFIVLHSGTFERIAFRHRAGQTLFLSDPIDTAQCKDPAYGAIQIGLFICILNDIRDRTLQLIAEEEKGTRAKRKRDILPADSRKRPRTRASVAFEEAYKLEYEKSLKAVLKGLTNRKLALLRIQHGPYKSSVPSSFLKVNGANGAPQRKYRPDEYFHVTITSKIAYGTTGDVHAATVELPVPGGKDISFPSAVVKLAFDDIQKKRLRHEYHVYGRLMSKDAHGVPCIFGLYEDIETEALALVMENAGSTLWDCRLPDKTERCKITISAAEKEGFVDALQSIHNHQASDTAT